MDWSITHLLSEDKAAAELLSYFHPEGLLCNRCGRGNYYRHRSFRPGIDKHRCRDCGHVFDLLSGTAFSGSHFSSAQLVLILRGFVQGQSTAHLAGELQIDRTNLLTIRHRLQKNATHNREDTPLTDQETETDEAYQNAGEKGIKHLDPDDPPRKRANKKRGLETSLTTGPASWEP